MLRLNRARAFAVVLLWLVLAVATSPFTLRLEEVTQAGQEAQLPAAAESARVAGLLNPADAEEPLPLAVIWTPRAEGERISPGQQEEVRQVALRLPDGAAPVLAPDGRAMIAVITTGPADLPAELATIRQTAASAASTSVHLAGPAADQADLDGAFSQTDGTLLIVALGGVLVILLLVYRSVLMPLLVITASLLALAAACAALYTLARSGLLPVDGQAQGIVFVLVVGASTDYALLLAARFREERAGQLDASMAMTAACRATAPPVLASAATIACAMMTLAFSDLPAEQALGPAVAIAMACCALVSLTFLPAALVLCGQRVLRPRSPRRTAAMWTKIARATARRPRRIWAGCLLVLALGASCAPLLSQTGVPLHQALPTGASSVAGHEVMARHFPAGTASPLVILAPAAQAADVRDRILAVPGVATASEPLPGPEGRAQILATLRDTSDSARARDVVERLRASLAGTEALVGGQSAQLADLHRAAVRGHRLIMPLVLAVVLAILIVLLRCLLLPLLLIAAAWISLFTAFGTAALFFRMVSGSAATEPAVVLFSFVFLVALGVDYNIFLVHRIRGEAVRHGTPAGVQRGVQTTSGVISAAGLILAATFASLTVMPLLYLAQIGCVVAVGVLIDTLLVRLFLVPALILDLGPRTWWPTRLPRDIALPAGGSRPAQGAEAPGRPAASASAS
ncbi:MMPL family transporter [Streptomyces sp. NPDC007818]|uniref:MMPL family transporter n=1 Tax=Streptomyces sp. NPDC007818 TaxID=3364780 RepID=UPI0036884B23